MTSPDPMHSASPVPSQPSTATTAAKVGKTAAKVGGAVGIALVYIIIRRLIGVFLILVGFYFGNLLGGGIWFLICPAILLVGYWVALRYIKAP